MQPPVSPSHFRCHISDSRPQTSDATRQSSAAPMIRRNRPGQRLAVSAPACTAAGDATVARKARNRHFALNSRRRLMARRAARARPFHPPAKASSAAWAAKTPPRTAKRRPSPVIGSMNPAASPANSNPDRLSATASMASGPRTTGGLTSRARANRSRKRPSRSSAEAAKRAAGARRAWSAGCEGLTRHTFADPQGTGATPT